MEVVEGIILILSCQKHRYGRLKKLNLKKQYCGWKVIKVIGNLFLNKDFELIDDILKLNRRIASPPAINNFMPYLTKSLFILFITMLVDFNFPFAFIYGSISPPSTYEIMINPVFELMGII